MTHLNALLNNVAALNGEHAPTAHQCSVLCADSRLSYRDGNIRNTHPCVSRSYQHKLVGQSAHDWPASLYALVHSPYATSGRMIAAQTA